VSCCCRATVAAARGTAALSSCPRRSRAGLHDLVLTFFAVNSDACIVALKAVITSNLDPWESAAAGGGARTGTDSRAPR
jgi:hypothetical protein